MAPVSGHVYRFEGKRRATWRAKYRLPTSDGGTHLHACAASAASGAFRALARRLPVIELAENRRQAAAWERDALALLRDGDPM
jgi:hypothetical protein